MPRLLFVFLATLMLHGSAVAQNTVFPASDHWCGTPHGDPFFAEAQEAFLTARAEGRLPQLARKTGAPADIGDRRTFNEVVDLSQSIGSASNYAAQEYELRDITDRYFLWVRVSELENGNVTEAEIAHLREQMMTSTPAASVNPNAGILVNINDLYGETPDYDRDGMLEILLYDIDPQTTSGQSTYGYFSPADVNPNVAAGVGNQADILYLDSNQGTRNPDVLASIAAHELVHLVHFTYGSDSETWISEGLAELGYMVNGYAFRFYAYPGDISETDRPLFDWTGSLEDYQRAGLFYQYLSEQVGAEAVAAMVKSPNKGAKGLTESLAAAGSSLEEQIANFHSANLVGDPSVSPVFAHAYLGSRVSKATPRQGRRINLGETGEAPRHDTAAGAVEYVRYSDVRNLALTMDVIGFPELLAEFRANFSARVFKHGFDGSVTWEDVPLRPESTTISGEYAYVDLAVAHLKPDRAATSPWTLASNWSQPVGTDNEPAEELPRVLALAQNYPNPFNPETTIAFDLPSSGQARLAVYDLLGRPVATLAEGLLPAGRHTVRFDASRLPSGSYLYRLELDGSSAARILTVAK